MEKDRFRPLVNSVFDFFDTLTCTVAVLNKPKNALSAICIWFAFELVFPSMPILHEALLAAYVLCTLPLAYFIRHGYGRLKAEEDAQKKVPYLGKMLFLRDRTEQEKRGIAAWYASIMVSLVVSMLIFFSLFLNITKLAAALGV